MRFLLRKLINENKQKVLSQNKLISAKLYCTISMRFGICIYSPSQGEYINGFILTNCSDFEVQKSKLLSKSYI